MAKGSVAGRRIRIQDKELLEMRDEGEHYAFFLSFFRCFFSLSLAIIISNSCRSFVLRSSDAMSCLRTFRNAPAKDAAVDTGERLLVVFLLGFWPGSMSESESLCGVLPRIIGGVLPRIIRGVVGVEGVGTLHRRPRHYQLCLQCCHLVQMTGS